MRFLRLATVAIGVMALSNISNAQGVDNKYFSLINSNTSFEEMTNYISSAGTDIPAIVNAVASNSPENLQGILEYVANLNQEMLVDVMFVMKNADKETAIKTLAMITELLQGNDDLLARLQAENEELVAEILNSGLDAQPAAGPTDLNPNTLPNNRRFSARRAGAESTSQVSPE